MARVYISIALIAVVHWNIHVTCTFGAVLHLSDNRDLKMPGLVCILVHVLVV